MTGPAPASPASRSRSRSEPVRTTTNRAPAAASTTRARLREPFSPRSRAIQASRPRAATAKPASTQPPLEVAGGLGREHRRPARAFAVVDEDHAVGLPPTPCKGDRERGSGRQTAGGILELAHNHEAGHQPLGVLAQTVERTSSACASGASGDRGRRVTVRRPPSVSTEARHEPIPEGLCPPPLPPVARTRALSPRPQRRHLPRSPRSRSPGAAGRAGPQARSPGPRQRPRVMPGPAHPSPAAVGSRCARAPTGIDGTPGSSAGARTLTSTPSPSVTSAPSSSHSGRTLRAAASASPPTRSARAPTRAASAAVP